MITGSGRGIGYTLARGLAEAGAGVVINDLRPGDCERVVAEFRSLGLKAEAAPFDVTDKAGVVAGVEKIEKDVAPLDILVNNAGIHRRAPLLEMEEGDWRKVVDTNLTSAFLVGQAAARGMVARKRGKIVNIVSLNCERPRPSIANYSSAKGGLVLLTRSMTVEWARHNIQVNGIAPGYILTEMTRPLAEDPERNAWILERIPSGRWGAPEDLIGAAVFLSSDASNFVNGHVMFVDGGMLVGL